MTPEAPSATTNIASARFSRLKNLLQTDLDNEALNALRESGVIVPAVDQNLALCHYARGEFEPARGLLEGLYAAGERSPAALRLLVSSCRHLGLMDRAVEIADANPQAAETDVALAGVYALVYLDADQAAKAMRHARTTLGLNPDSVDGLIVRDTEAEHLAEKGSDAVRHDGRSTADDAAPGLN